MHEDIYMYINIFFICWFFVALYDNKGSTTTSKSALAKDKTKFYGALAIPVRLCGSVWVGATLELLLTFTETFYKSKCFITIFSFFSGSFCKSLYYSAKSMSFVCLLLRLPLWSLPVYCYQNSKKSTAGDFTPSTVRNLMQKNCVCAVHTHRSIS